MAHRKPLGTTCSAHFARGSWDVDPQLGDFLVSTAGTAYLIVGIAEGPRRIHYTLERVAGVPDPVRAGELRVFEFYWLARERARPFAVDGHEPRGVPA